ncbi:MAG: arsenic efflux protein, partial [Clostridia bacterium]|nr:arsenic efflux protein [Clostridia bacterium]
EHCHCEEKGIIHSSLHHTLHISFFLLLIMLLLNAAVFFAGEESLSLIFSRVPFIGHLTAGLIGLIPNCASSVLLTQLYLDGVLSAGTMLSGLLAGAGVGVLVLFRMNKHPKENLCIVALLYAVGTVSGFLFDLLQLGTLLRL